MAPAVRSRHPTGHDAVPDSAVPDSTAPDNTAPSDAASHSTVPGRWPPPGTIRDRWTADDLADLPQDGLRYEIIDGTLLVSPAPAWRHQRLSLRLAVALDDACPADCEVLTAPYDWRISETVVVQPDLLVMRSTGSGGPHGTPLLVVEILSPSSITADRMIKFARYADAGVGQYWIVDPGSPDHDPTIEIYNLTDGEYVLHTQGTGGDRLSITGPIDVTLTPADLIR